MQVRRSLAVLLPVALFLAGCSAPAPAADLEAVPTPTANATVDVIDATTPTVVTARPIPDLGAPCWDTAGASPEARGDPGRYESAGIARADVVAVELGIANARRYVAACMGGDMPEAALAALVVEIVSASGGEPQGGLREGAPFVRVDIAHAGWNATGLPWSASAERVRLAAFAYGQAWLAQAGCARDATPGWIHQGFAEHVAYGSSTLAGDVKGEDVGATIWRRAESSGDLTAPLPATPGATSDASLLAQMLLLAFASEPRKAPRLFCSTLAGGAAPEQAFASTFDLSMAEHAATWAVFRAQTPTFAAGAGLVFPAAPPVPACFADVAADDAPDVVVVVDENVPEVDAANLRQSLATTWSFVRSCFGATELQRFHNYSITLQSLDGAGYNGGGWSMDGGPTGVQARIDASHQQFASGPREWTAGAWARSQMASIGAYAWLDSHDCRPRDAQLPAWIRDGVTQYIVRSAAAASGDVGMDVMRRFTWDSAVGSGQAGKPLSTWIEYGPNGWSGDWSYFAFERLVAGSEDGPRSIASFCAGLAQGESLGTAFATAFGERLATVADDPVWPAGSA